MKTCSICGEAKPLEDFYGNGTYPRGECKPCTCFIQAAGRYGLSREELKALYEKQEYKCAICRQACKSYGSLSVDHDHTCCSKKTRSCGKCVRGLLCAACNRGLGYFQDNPELLRAAAEYLSRG